MAEVTGSIGNQPVELNNAATEATLRLLLQAVQGKGGAGGVANLAGQTINPQTVAQVNSSLSTMQRAGQMVGQGFGALGNAISANKEGIQNFVSKLNEGKAEVSDMIGMFKNLPGPIGKVAKGFELLAIYQQENFAAYQKVTAAGVSFGGSLTDLRVAAAATSLTLQDFTSLMKENSKAFLLLGGNVNEGAKNFVLFSNSLTQGETGRQLRALGLTTQEINSGFAAMIASQGGLSKKEQQNLDLVTKSSKDLFLQMDALAQLTGISKEEQEKEMKERAANAAIQNYLASLEPAERAKANAAMQEAFARGGEGAKEALASKLMGIPPLTDRAQQFEAVITGGSEALGKLASDVKNSSKSVEDVQKTGVQISRSLQKAGQENQDLFRVMVMSGDTTMMQTASKALSEATRARTQDINTLSDEEARLAAVRQDQQKRMNDSQAKDMASAKAALDELTKGFHEMLNPIVSALTPVLSALAQGLKDVLLPVFKTVGDALTFMKNKFDELGIKVVDTSKLLAALVAAGAAYGIYKMAIPGAGGGGGGAGGGKGPLGLPGLNVPGSSASSPLYVVVVGQAPGGPGLPELPDKGGKGSPGKQGGGGGGKDIGSKMGNILKGVKGLGVGTLLGIGGDLAADAFGRDTTAGKSADTIGTAASWAGTGAMLGSVVPGLGTALGAGVGAVAGGAYGLYKNFFNDKNPEEGMPKMASGGVIVGENGAEAIIPLTNENALPGIKELNTTMNDILRYMKDTAENTKKAAEATQNLSGDLFA